MTQSRAAWLPHALRKKVARTAARGPEPLGASGGKTATLDKWREISTTGCIARLVAITYIDATQHKKHAQDSPRLGFYILGRRFSIAF